MAWVWGNPYVWRDLNSWVSHMFGEIEDISQVPDLVNEFKYVK